MLPHPGHSTKPGVKTSRRRRERTGHQHLSGVSQGKKHNAQFWLFKLPLERIDRHYDRFVRHAGRTEKIAGYLATHFPSSKKRAPKLIPGSNQISFKKWTVPTLGQRSRDPVEAADGTIWWAGQWGNLIGKINPKTGEMKEYPLPDRAKSHSVTLDRAGNVWYTGNKNGTIGKFDPKTEKITEYKMPNPAAREPHTAIFDSNGILWFTLQHSNMVGRLDPTTGAIKLVTMKTP